MRLGVRIGASLCAATAALTFAATPATAADDDLCTLEWQHTADVPKPFIVTDPPGYGFEWEPVYTPWASCLP